MRLVVIEIQVTLSVPGKLLENAHSNGKLVGL